VLFGRTVKRDASAAFSAKEVRVSVHVGPEAVTVIAAGPFESYS